MKKLFDQKPVLFAVIWIMIYVVGFGSAGIQTQTPWLNYALQSAVGLVIAGVLLIFAKKRDLLAHWGFTGIHTAENRMLFFIPMLLAMTSNVWLGFGFREDTPAATLFGILAIGVICPFLEELIMRSMLFRAIGKQSTRQGFWFASLAFGVGHAVNLVYGKDVMDTLVQMVYASCIGFCFTAVLYTTSSIVPTVLAHMLCNTLNFFAKQNVSEVSQMIVIAVMCVICVAYGCYVLYVHRDTHPLKPEPLPEV